LQFFRQDGGFKFDFSKIKNFPVSLLHYRFFRMLSMWKEIIALDGAGFWFVFKTRWSRHIEMYEFHHNIEFGPINKSDGIIISFHGPNKIGLT